MHISDKDARLVRFLWILWFGIFLIPSLNKDFKNQNRISDELLVTIKEQSPERLFNSYNAGGYLFYHDVEVFIDGRYEPYADSGVVQTYRTLVGGPVLTGGNFKAVLDECDFDLFLVSENDPYLLDFLKNSDGYKLIGSDENYFLYVPLNNA